MEKIKGIFWWVVGGVALLLFGILAIFKSKGTTQTDTDSREVIREGEKTIVIKNEALEKEKLEKLKRLEDEDSKKKAELEAKNKKLKADLEKKTLEDLQPTIDETLGIRKKRGRPKKNG